MKNQEEKIISVSVSKLKWFLRVRGEYEDAKYYKTL